MTIEQHPQGHQMQISSPAPAPRRRTALLLFATQASVAVLGLPVTVVLARTMGPEDYGTFQFLNRLALVAVTVLCLGYPHAIAWRSAASTTLREDRGVVRALLGVSLGGGGIAFAVAAVVFLVGASPGDPLSWWLISLFPLANLVSANLVNFFRGKLLPSGIAWIKLTQVIAWAAAVLCGALTGQLSVPWAVGASVASQFLSIAVGMVLLGRRGQLLGNRVRIDNLGLFRFAIATYPGLALRDVNIYAAQLLIGFLLSAYDLGIYAAAVSLSSVLGLLSGPITNTMQPVVQHARENERARTVSLSFAATGIAVGVPAAILIAAAGWLVPLLYGNEFAGSVVIVQILAAAAFVDALGGVAYGSLVGAGRPGRSSVSAAIGALATVVLVVALMPVWGASGAALATLTANIVTFAIALFSLCRSLRITTMRMVRLSMSSFPTVLRMGIDMIRRKR